MAVVVGKPCCLTGRGVSGLQTLIEFVSEILYLLLDGLLLVLVVDLVR